MRAQMAELVRLTIARDPALKSKTAALRDENLSLQMRRAELLNEHGHEPEYLDAIYSCPKCRDTGIYEGGVCSCLERLYNRELTKELGTLMQNGDESFEKFDLLLYPESFDPAAGRTARGNDACVRALPQICRELPERLLEPAVPRAARAWENLPLGLHCPRRRRKGLLGML